jgi:PAS domain-containing protein
MGAGSHLAESFVTGKALSLRGLILEKVPSTSAHRDGWCLALTELMAGAVNALGCAVVLTNEHGTILHTNRAGERMLHEGGPIQSDQGILQATTPSATAELRSAFALATRNEAGTGKTGLAIRLTEADGPPIFARVLPLTGSDFRARLQPSAVAAVFIGAPPDAQDGAVPWLPRSV